MSGMVNDLMALARLDELREPIREPVDLRGLVSDACDDARAVAPDREISLTRARRGRDPRRRRPAPSRRRQSARQRDRAHARRLADRSCAGGAQWRGGSQCPRPRAWDRRRRDRSRSSSASGAPASRGGATAVPDLGWRSSRASPRHTAAAFELRTTPRVAPSSPFGCRSASPRRQPDARGHLARTHNAERPAPREKGGPLARRRLIPREAGSVVVVSALAWGQSHGRRAAGHCAAEIGRRWQGAAVLGDVLEEAAVAGEQEASFR